MFEGPISNNKNNIAPSTPWTPVAKIILLNFFDVYGNFSFLV